VHLDAEWVAPSLVRDRVTAWLRAHRWPDDQLDDVVFAVSEAVSNCVEHGYGIAPRSTARPGVAPVEVSAEIVADGAGRRVAVVVRDHGSWVPPATGPTDRGRGLPLMRASMARVEVRRGAAGTTVVLRSHRVPLLPPG
jgi:anti-sigma regulatory factor (Ser/Thr protein kinase)